MPKLWSGLPLGQETKTFSWQYFSVQVYSFILIHLTFIIGINFVSGGLCRCVTAGDSLTN